MGWKELKIENLDPIFAHVYAVFFYPKSVSWQDGRRNPHETWPQLKAIVNSRTNKAYWMAEYANGLFKNGKIQKVTAEGETEKDRARYMKKKGIVMVERPASESDLLEGKATSEPLFDAKILNKKESYRVHDSVQFWSYYEGNLPNAFFDNEILAPNGKVFPPPYSCKDHSQHWSPDYRTLDPNTNLGRLNGQVSETSTWNFIIEPGYPKGVYTVRMRLYFQPDPRILETRKHLPEIVDTITIV